MDTPRDNQFHFFFKSWSQLKILRSIKGCRKFNEREIMLNGFQLQLQYFVFELQLQPCITSILEQIFISYNTAGNLNKFRINFYILYLTFFIFRLFIFFAAGLK
jgi:hypothetical protein